MEPAVPELSFRPDFMANMENHLTFFEIASIKAKEDSDWKTLRLIEHLFETKLFFGNKSSFHVLLLNRREWKPYCLELLESFFDRITYGFEVERFRDLYAVPKEVNFRLWNLERDFQRSRPFFDDERFLGKFQYRCINGKELENEVFQKLLRLGLHVRRQHSVRNLKNYYLKRDIDLRFYFDFYVNGKIIEVKSFRALKNITLQDLLVKSRLIRYEKRDGTVERIHPELRGMILLVNGDIMGPNYDKFRYLRMLTSAGWDVYPADINLKKLGELI